MYRSAWRLLPLILGAGALGAQQGPRIVVTPTNPRMVARTRCGSLPACWMRRAAPCLTRGIRYFAGGAGFEAAVDSTLVTSGAVGKFPVTVSALVPGSRPVTARVEVQMVAGPAARVAITPRPTRMLAGQRLQLQAAALSADGDSATERASAGGPRRRSVVRIDERGIATAVAPGRATVTAVAGAATSTWTSRGEPSGRLSGERHGRDRLPLRRRRRPRGKATCCGFRRAGQERSRARDRRIGPELDDGPGRGEINSDGSFVGFEPGSYLVTANLGRVSGDVSVNLTDRNVRRRPS
ncbi:MAG: Ig-like domain-containing protein [Gemmatimonadetes bacterium]|nr:Ig-like domain-containing protein [Gemmatimonadota bacterium]